jgi:predicted membrane protein
MRLFIYIFACRNRDMRKSYTKIYSRILLLAVAMLMSFTMVATPIQAKNRQHLFAFIQAE